MSVELADGITTGDKIELCVICKVELIDCDELENRGGTTGCNTIELDKFEDCNVELRDGFTCCKTLELNETDWDGIASDGIVSGWREVMDAITDCKKVELDGTVLGRNELTVDEIDNEIDDEIDS